MQSNKSDCYSPIKFFLPSAEINPVLPVCGGEKTLGEQPAVVTEGKTMRV